MNAILQLVLSIDREVFHAINSLAGKSGVLDFLIRLGSDDHIIPLILSLTLLAILIHAKSSDEKKSAINCIICAFIAVAISMVFLFILNSLFFRPRPFTSCNVKLLFYHSTDSSFPSNAATLAFVIAFVILFYNKRAGFFALALSFYLGFSRIAAGIHYPLDIAGGILLGFSCATFSRSLENLCEPITKTLTNTIARLMGSVPGAGKEKSAWEK